MEADPRFRNRYFLSWNSPCIGVGILGKKVYAGGFWVYYYPFIPDTDIQGDPREGQWVEETPNHYYKYCDIGADEFVGSKPCLTHLELLLLGD